MAGTAGRCCSQAAPEMLIHHSACMPLGVATALPSLLAPPLASQASWHMCALPPGLQALQLDALVGRQWSIVACSAVDGSGLLEGFDWLVKDIAARIYLLE